MILSSYLLFTCMCIIESLFYCHFDRIFSILKGTFMTLMFITSIVCLGKRKTNRIIFQEQKGSFINFEFLNLIGLEKKLHFPPIIFIFYYTNLFLYIVNESQLPQTKMEAHKDLVSHPVPYVFYGGVLKKTSRKWLTVAIFRKWQVWHYGLKLQ